MVTSVASFDTETRSAIDLKKAGLHRYFEDDTTSVLCLCWRLGDNRVERWDTRLSDNKGPPLALVEHIRAGGTIIAHNNGFDRHAWNDKLAPLYNLPLISIDQCDCTMARGAAMALPQSLDELGKALRAPIRKDLEGHRLMMRLSRPIGWTDEGEPLFDEDPVKHERNVDYCEADVASERAIDKIVPQLTPTERAVWRLDQKINDRGVAVDVLLTGRALDTVEIAKKRADKTMRELTQGHVHKVTEVKKIVDWLNGRGVVCESIAKGEVEEIILRTKLVDDPIAQEAIELRRAAAKSSTAKYQAILNAVCGDGRVRGSLRYHGASTGRWAGSGMQPQNFPRVLDADAVTETLNILQSIADPVEACNAIGLFVGEPMSALSRCLRAMLVAAPGRRLLGADYSNIEGRVNAWLAGEEWKVQAFRDFDAGIGEDLYVLSYAAAFGIDPTDVTKALRQIGKVMELSMGYQGGWRAFEKMGANYGVSVGQERAEELKKAWREAHPSIQQSWWDLQSAAIDAVMHPGIAVPCLSGRIRYKVAHGFLWCLLPSGRTLSYASPRIIWVVRDEKFVVKDSSYTKNDMEEVVLEAELKGKYWSVRPQVEFMGVDSTTKKWGKHQLYGGLQCENVVQAISRDILVDAMLRVEEAGYPIVLTVHDEIIAEVPDGFGSKEEFETLMAQVPAWAKGLPVAVAGWEDVRYVK